MNTERILGFIAVTALTVLVVVMGSVWLSRPDPTLPPALSMEKPEDISPLSFVEVMAITSRPTTKTALQISDAMSDILGKRIYWDGYVGRVSECGHNCFVGLYMKPVFLQWFAIDDTIHLEEGKGNPWAQIHFDAWHRSQLLKLQIGQKIRVGCTFDRFHGKSTPILEDCNLIGMAAIPEWHEPIPELLDFNTGKPRVKSPKGQPQVIDEVKGFLRELPLVGSLLNPVL